MTSRTFVLESENIDTDQIIPARFLTTTSREGLGEQAFYDWRYNADGTPKADETLNSVDTSTHQILVAGRNFGCGSSREHAPWALTDFGFRVVISSEIADIFRSNALKNGLLPIVIEAEAHQWLLDNPGAEVTVDLEDQSVRFGNHECHFSVEAFARRCLLDGVDQLGFLQSKQSDIEAFEAARA
jgi:3-isopropylmalate/(R)-2-methylmalate dehydratase small subunit